MGPAITSIRRAALRLIAPSLADLLVQLERDRRRAERRIDELTERVARLEGEGDDAPAPAGRKGEAAGRRAPDG